MFFPHKYAYFQTKPMREAIEDVLDPSKLTLDVPLLKGCNIKDIY